MGNKKVGHAFNHAPILDVGVDFARDLIKSASLSVNCQVSFMKPHKDHLLIYSHYSFLSEGGISFAIAICRLTVTPGFY
jgi:hypothetical protein